MQKIILILLALFCFLSQGISQQPVIAAAVPRDTTTQLEILPGSGRYTYLKKDSATTLLSLAARAYMKQGSSKIDADSAILNLNTKIMEAFGNVHINDADSVNTYSSYLKYFSKEKKALLTKNVRLVDSKGGVLTTNELNYDLNTKIGVYTKNGKVVNGKTTLTSTEGTYFGETKDVVFRKNVLLIDPEYQLVADSLLYNTQTQIVTFICPTTIITTDRKIYTSDGYYNLKTGKAFFGKRASIVDSTSSTTADEMAFDDKNKTAQFRGNVVYKDTAQGISILSGILNVDRLKSTFLATKHPVMILKQDNDSIFITADTLYAGKLTDRKKIKNVPTVIEDSLGALKVYDLLGKDSALNRFFEAFHNVRIFSDSLQSTCDSMFYASTDSVFRLYTHPIVWASNSQVTGDTIYLFTKYKKADRMYAFEDGFIINRLRGEFFNQVKGHTINALFKGGNIDYVRTKGNAESVYYATDGEDKLIGVNKATADAIDMFFVNKAANKVKFISDLKGTTYPIRQISAEDVRLRNFNWQEEKRPKTKFELFEEIKVIKKSIDDTL